MHVRLLALALLAAPPASAVVIGQVDDFESGTLGWTSGLSSPTPPERVADGGPDGAGDAWLLVAGNGGDGPGSRVAALNTTQWTGDYTGAGAIEMDLQAPAPASPVVRLYFRSDGGACAVATQTAHEIASGAGWARYAFPIDLASLTNDFPDGCADVAAAMADVEILRISHSPDLYAASGFPPLAGELGVDDVTLVPEPDPAAGGAAALALLLARRRRRPAIRRRAKSSS